MLPQQLRKRKGKKGVEFQKDSYEASLTPEERQSLYAMLRSDMPFEEVRKATVPWRTGEDAGKQPTLRTLYAINSRLDLEAILVGIEGTATFVEHTHRRLRPYLKGTDGEKVLDQAMELIGREVIRRTLYRLNPAARTAAARLLLKRADQRRVDRRLDMLEAEFKKDAPAKTGTRLTPEETEARYRQILSIE
jgi:hypothetical protein